MTTRRNLLKAGLLGGASLYFSGWRWLTSAGANSTAVPLNSATLTKFVDPLPLPSVLQPAGRLRGAPYYAVAMTQFTQKLHRDLPATMLWGYNGSYPGPTIETRRDHALFVRWSNNLPTQHLFSYAIDPQLHGAEADVPQVRTVTHVHGAHVEPNSDGFPEFWFTPDATAPANGMGGPAGNHALYHYSNTQPATALWYHDHALGITRLNVYAGLAGFYLIRDDAEHGLHLPKGDYEIPLLIQDRMFNNDGSLLYPVQGQVPADGVMPDGSLVPPGTPGSRTVPTIWIPEFFGDTMLVNGKVWPYLEVEPRKYRFRLLNGCNARFLNLSLDSGQRFYQIGSDGGLLDAPVPLTELLVAPAERADLIVDFSNYAGSTLTLTNNAPTPYPGGGDANDPANNSHTAQVMQFRVKRHAHGRDNSELPGRLRPVERIPETMAVRVRDLTLNELDHPITEDPVIALLGTLQDGASEPLTWMDPTTETPHEDSVEIWRIFNLTGDTHPIHVHLVQFQILDRQNLLLDTDGDPTFTPDPLAPQIPPDLNEAGWKDTVRMNPETVTRIIARFQGYNGRYVWHCHILEHEDNDMMRPYQVTKP